MVLLLTQNVTICALCLQWFGNLVTMKWWNDLWLNEGFATFMENLAMKIVFPDLYTVGTWRIGGLHISHVLFYGSKFFSLDLSLVSEVKRLGNNQMRGRRPKRLNNQKRKLKKDPS